MFWKVGNKFLNPQAIAVVEPSPNKGAVTIFFDDAGFREFEGDEATDLLHWLNHVSVDCADARARHEKEDAELDLRNACQWEDGCPEPATVGSIYCDPHMQAAIEETVRKGGYEQAPTVNIIRETPAGGDCLCTSADPIACVNEGLPWTAGENIGCACECHQVPATRALICHAQGCPELAKRGQVYCQRHYEEDANRKGIEELKADRLMCPACGQPTYSPYYDMCQSTDPDCDYSHPGELSELKPVPPAA